MRVRDRAARAARRVAALALVVLAAPLLAASPAVEVELSAEERLYLDQAGAIPFCVDPDWAPFEVIDARGEHQGIGADLLRLAAERAGVALELVWTSDWEESLAAARTGRCLMLSFLNRTPERERWLIFTQPLFEDPNVFITREEHPYISNPAGLEGASIALPRGTAVEEWVRRDFPNLHIVHTDTEAEALGKVSRREANMTLRSLTVAANTIRSEGWFNLKIAGHAQGYDNQLRVGVRQDEPLLRDILDKAIATITPAERARVVNRHVAITIQPPTDYRLLAQIAFVFAAVLLTNLYWIARLRRANRELRVRSQTDALTGLRNRSELNRRFAEYLARAVRYERPLSVILLDLDGFKQVNDLLGHLGGDSVLKDFAAVLNESVRSTDCVGRWGGEEFLVLCPETAEAQALALAERICAATRDHAFASGRRHTVSAGVATLAAADSADDLLQRADGALYQAKNEGRDRACFGPVLPQSA